MFAPAIRPMESISTVPAPLIFTRTTILREMAPINLAVVIFLQAGTMRAAPIFREFPMYKTQIVNPRKFHSFCGAIALLLLTSIAAQADEGRIPIYGPPGQTLPITISAPGSYVLTRDINAGTSDAIHINASNVTLDLNGHTIAGTSSSG